MFVCVCVCVCVCQVSALLLEEEGRGEADVVLIKEETPGEEQSRSEEQEDLLISEDGEQSTSVPPSTHFYDRQTFTSTRTQKNQCWPWWSSLRQNN